MDIQTIGIDLGKTVFVAVALDGAASWRSAPGGTPGPS